jgi:hypothetical protein
VFITAPINSPVSRDAYFMGNLTNSVKPSSSTQLLKYFPIFYGTRRSQEPSTGPYPKPQQSSAHSLRFIIILYLHMFRGPPNGLFHHKFLYTFLFSIMRTTFLFHLTLLDFIILIVFIEDEIPSNFLLLRPSLLPHSPQPMCFS